MLCSLSVVARLHIPVGPGRGSPGADTAPKAAQPQPTPGCVGLSPMGALTSTRTEMSNAEVQGTSFLPPRTGVKQQQGSCPAHAPALLQRSLNHSAVMV